MRFGGGYLTARKEIRAMQPVLKQLVESRKQITGRRMRARKGKAGIFPERRKAIRLPPSSQQESNNNETDKD
jgi:hypothetical protein